MPTFIKLPATVMRTYTRARGGKYQHTAQVDAPNMPAAVTGNTPTHAKQLLIESVLEALARETTPHVVIAGGYVGIIWQESAHSYGSFYIEPGGTKCVGLTYGGGVQSSFAYEEQRLRRHFAALANDWSIIPDTDIEGRVDWYERVGFNNAYKSLQWEQPELLEGQRHALACDLAWAYMNWSYATQPDAVRERISLHMNAAFKRNQERIDAAHT